MSNRQSKTHAVTFQPVLQNKSRPPGGWFLAFGIIYPAIVIVIELATHFCANVFFDPIPTYWHLVAVAFVPASNLLIWAHLRSKRPWNVKLLAFANGTAIAIASVYALLFLPLLPLALPAIAFGIGLFPFAPLASFVGALNLRSTLSRTHLHRKPTRPLIGGLAAGLALVIAADVQPAATRIGIGMAVSNEPATHERGLALLRILGDDDLLLRLCYDSAGRPSLLLSALDMVADLPSVRSNNRYGQVAALPAQVR